MLRDDIFPGFPNPVEASGTSDPASETTAGIAELATQAETDAGTDDARIVTPLKLASFPAMLIECKNTSGGTLTAGSLVYTLYTSGSGIEAKSPASSSVLYAASAAVVVVGGANNADIKVASRGRHSIFYSGTAPSVGDYLILAAANTVARQTYMSPEVIAIAQAAGSGGSVDALLITGTVFVPIINATRLYGLANHSSTKFTATINGTPTTTSVVYNNALTGNENVLNVQAAGQLAKAVLHNTTRGNSRLIDSVNVATNTITTVASTDNWANTDAITIASPTVISDNGSADYIELDLSQTTAIPALARMIRTQLYKLDTGAVGQRVDTHPFETFVAVKEQVWFTQASSVYVTDVPDTPLINRKFTYRSFASGTGTAQTHFDLQGYWLAVP